MATRIKPELFWQIKESVRGLAEACRAFNAPVTGGNCSLYNQSPAGPIDPTPTVAVVGLIEKPEHITTQWFKDEGDAIILLGEIVDADDPLLGLGGRPYLQVVHGKKTGTPPRCDLEQGKNLAHHVAGLDSIRAWSRARMIAAKAVWRCVWRKVASANRSRAERRG